MQNFSFGGQCPVPPAGTCLNCRGIILHFLRFSFLITFVMAPILAKCGHHHYQQHFQNSPSSTAQPLSGGTLPNTPSSNVRLVPSDGIINSSTTFKVVAIFPVDHFIASSSLHENLKSIHPLQVSTKEYKTHEAGVL